MLIKRAWNTNILLLLLLLIQQLVLTESLPDRLLFELPKKFDSIVNLLEAVTFFSDSFPESIAGILKKIYIYTIECTTNYTSQNGLRGGNFDRRRSNCRL